MGNMLRIRTLTNADDPFALALTRGEGWDPPERLFEICRAHDPDGCFVAERRGARVGLVTTTRYARTAWIGNLVVVAHQRRRGFGEVLMRHAVDHLCAGGVTTIRLEADPPGIRIYRRLGFVDEFDSLRYERRPAPAATASDLQHLTEAARPGVCAFDRDHFGDDRGRLLAILMEHAAARYWLPGPGGIRGYALVFRSQNAARVGPCVAVDADAAERLWRAILGEWGTMTIKLGLPQPNEAARALFQELGFRATPGCLRMVLGARVAAGKPERIYGIANGAFG